MAQRIQRGATNKKWSNAPRTHTSPKKTGKNAKFGPPGGQNQTRLNLSFKNQRGATNKSCRSHEVRGMKWHSFCEKMKNAIFTVMFCFHQLKLDKETKKFYASRKLSQNHKSKRNTSLNVDFISVEITISMFEYISIKYG